VPPSGLSRELWRRGDGGFAKVNGVVKVTHCTSL
jgi:hypothetical protein